ncbi:MAG TPA: hypothetical protein VI413_05960, partial [Paludibacter sp.]
GKEIQAEYKTGSGCKTNAFLQIHVTPGHKKSLPAGRLNYCKGYHTIKTVDYIFFYSPLGVGGRFLPFISLFNTSETLKLTTAPTTARITVLTRSSTNTLLKMERNMPPHVPAYTCPSWFVSGSSITDRL